jgi:hypothetical protein
MVGPRRSWPGPQSNDPPCHSCTTQGTRLSGTRQGQSCTKNPERTDVWDETLGETRRHQWNKKSRLKGATTSEGEESWQDLQEGSHTEDREVKT